MDPRALLATPAVLKIFKRVITRAGGAGELVARHIRAWPGARILDIACGLGQILELLPAVSYEGFDIDPTYIASATRHYGHRGTFRCADVTRVDVKAASYDIVMAIGVLHHLDDEQARTMIALARRALVTGGRLVTFDGCYAPGQSRIARLLLASDRGRHVRDQEGYVRLVGEQFPQVAASLRHDWLRLPYTHIILEGTRQDRPAA
jgi:SAM-dependent methyltransferase